MWFHPKFSLTMCLNCRLGSPETQSYGGGVTRCRARGANLNRQRALFYANPLASETSLVSTAVLGKFVCLRSGQVVRVEIANRERTQKTDRSDQLPSAIMSPTSPKPRCARESDVSIVLWRINGLARGVKQATSRLFRGELEYHRRLPKGHSMEKSVRVQKQSLPSDALLCLVSGEVRCRKCPSRS